MKPGVIKRSVSPENARSSPFNAADSRTLKTVVPRAIILPPFFLVSFINEIASLVNSAHSECILWSSESEAVTGKKVPAPT